MRIDKSNITGFQFMLLIACYIQASGLLTSFVSMILMQDSWVAVILASFAMIPLILLYRLIIVKFPGKNLFQIFEIVYGKAIGKAISVFFVIFFISTTLLNYSDMAGFTKLTLMYKTPNYVIIGLSVFVASFMIRHGLKSISRFSFMIFSMSIFILVLTCLLLLNQFDVNNFLPIFAQEPIRYVQATHHLLAIPLGEFVIFLMFTQNVRVKKKDWNKFIFTGFFLGFVLLLLVKIRDIAVLGSIFHMLSLPQLISLKLVNLGEALSRMEVLFALILTLMLFLKTTLLMYATLIGICQIFEVEEFWRLIPILAIMIVVLSRVYTSYNTEKNLDFGRQVQPFLVIIFEYIIPYLTLFIAMITKKTTDKGFGKTKPYLKNSAIKNFQKIKPATLKKELGM